MRRQRTGIVADSLSSLVQKEDIVDQLNGQGFADSRPESMDNASSHQAVKRRCLRAADESGAVLAVRQRQYPVDLIDKDLMVQAYEDQ